MFLLNTDIVIAKLKNWEQVSSLTTDIEAFSMMESFYGGGGGGAFMRMHETRMHENYDLKWSQTWPLFFYFLQRETGGLGGKPSSFSSTLFVFFFLLSPKKKKIRNKKETRKEELKQKKENRKRIPFFYCQQVAIFWPLAFWAHVFSALAAILFSPQSDTAIYSS